MSDLRFEPDYDINETLVRKNYFQWAEALGKIARLCRSRPFDVSRQTLAEFLDEIEDIAQKALEEE